MVWCFLAPEGFCYFVCMNIFFIQPGPLIAALPVNLTMFKHALLIMFLLILAIGLENWPRKKHRYGNILSVNVTVPVISTLNR